ncbi:MAG: cytochrome c oxidase subunit I [Candidatus Hodarchaeales archaeon]
MRKISELDIINDTSNQKMPEKALHGSHPPFYKNWRTLLGTTNHAEIGILYILLAIVSVFIGGTLAMIMRTELAIPGPTIVNKELYSVIFTAHGTIMIFLVIFPLGAGFGNYLVPKLIGAPDMYWPRWNNAALWLLIPAGFLIFFAQASAGWTVYTPLSIIGGGIDMWIIGVLLAGVSSLVSAINFLMTIVTMRKPGLTWGKLDLFSWSIIATSIIQLCATPLITTGLTLLLSDRILDTAFFTASAEGVGTFLWQHVFWSYSHPAVYIMVLPAMGLTSLMIQKFSRNEIFGYKSMVVSMLLITFLGFLVWGHHQYTLYGAAADAVTTTLFSILTSLIAVPSGIKTFNWLLTMWGGHIKLEVPLVFPFGFIIGFVIGGLTGVWLNIVPLDIGFHDTAFVVGHFHIIILGGALTALIGAFYNYFPEMTGKMYHRNLAWVHCFMWIIGFFVTFNSMMIAGANGMPRRIFDYSTFGNVDTLAFWNFLATLGAYLMFASGVIFVINMIYSLRKGPAAGDDPFNLAIDKLPSV